MPTKNRRDALRVASLAAAVAVLCYAWISVPAPAVETEPSQAPADSLPAAATTSDLTTAAGLAKTILDDGVADQTRRALIKDNPQHAVEIVRAMTADLIPGSPEEYRRIPWIWRVSINAVRQGDQAQIREFLDLSLPQVMHARGGSEFVVLDEGLGRKGGGPIPGTIVGEPLLQWQAVIIGGAVINGIGLNGHWPLEQIEAILKADDANHSKDSIVAGLRGRWNYAIAESAKMADNEGIITGTRYDALRMIAMLPWDECGGKLTRYLVKGIHPELQMGAVSGISDVSSPAAAQALLSGMSHYADDNRVLAVDALLRSDERTTDFLDALAEGRVRREQLTDQQVQRLREYPTEALRTRAAEILGPQNP